MTDVVSIGPLVSAREDPDLAQARLFLAVLRREIAQTATAIDGADPPAPYTGVPAGDPGPGCVLDLRRQQRELQRMIDRLLARFPELCALSCG